MPILSLCEVRIPGNVRFREETRQACVAAAANSTFPALGSSLGHEAQHGCYGLLRAVFVHWRSRQSRGGGRVPRLVISDKPVQFIGVSDYVTTLAG
jgi:hypothetical protein